MYIEKLAIRDSEDLGRLLGCAFHGHGSLKLGLVRSVSHISLLGDCSCFPLTSHSKFSEHVQKEYEAYIAEKSHM